jgi:hypothetical protein
LPPQNFGERFFVGRQQIDDDPRRLAIFRLDDEGFLNQNRSDRVHDNARAAFVDETVAEGFDEAAPRTASRSRELERNLLQIDDDTVGIGQHIGIEVDRNRQVGDEAGADGVATEPRSRRGRRRGAPPEPFGGRRRQGDDHQRKRERGHEAKPPWPSVKPNLPSGHSHFMLGPPARPRGRIPEPTLFTVG